MRALRMLLRVAWLDLVAIPGAAMAVLPLLVGRRPVRERPEAAHRNARRDAPGDEGATACDV